MLRAVQGHRHVGYRLAVDPLATVAVELDDRRFRRLLLDAERGPVRSSV